MNICAATIHLYDDNQTRCEKAAGHKGPHHSDAWGPRIDWTHGVNDARSAA